MGETTIWLGKKNIIGVITAPSSLFIEVISGATNKTERGKLYRQTKKKKKKEPSTFSHF